MSTLKIAFTGHRPNKLDNDYELVSDKVLDIKERIITAINPYMLSNTIEFITGMALGIDTLAALIALEYNIPYIASIPCLNQDYKWSYNSRKLYHTLLTKAKLVHFVTQETYSLTCMQKRNEWMVDNCDILIAVWDGSTGGTKNCIDYAVKQNKQIIFIKI